MQADTRTQQRLADEAMEWLLRLEGEVSMDTRSAFMEWCEKSRDHVQAFLEVSVLDRQLDGIDPRNEMNLEALIQRSRETPPENVVALHATPTVTTDVQVTLPTRRRRLALGMAAVLAGIALTGASLYVLNSHAPTYDTRLGEQRSIKLDDGSAVYLNTRSRVRVNYTQTARDIELLEGEAYFVVAQDRARPFKVLTPAATVRALGTAFNVYLDSGKITVAVVEGRVQVADAAPLIAGESAQVTANGAVVKHNDLDVSRVTAWRQRQLDFRHTTLAEVIAQFNRYNTLQLRIEDPQIAQRRINGVFDADSPQQLLDFLAQKDDLSFERGTGSTLIRAKNADSASQM